MNRLPPVTWTLPLLLSLVFGSAVAAAQGVKVARVVPFAESSRATTAVREECGLQTRIPELLADAALDVELVDALPETGRSLHLRITDVQAPGGGMFSGPKWLEVSGKLSDGGRNVASFRAKRLTTGGPFGGGGTCGMLSKCARAIAGDVALWLEAPTPNAELGDAR